MKKCIHVFCLLLIVSSLRAQIPYYDALTLFNRLDEDKNIRFSDTLSLAILDHYIEPDKQNTRQEIIDAWESTSNPFFEISGIAQGVPTRLVPGELTKGLGSVAASFTGLNVSTFADGLAKFLVGRVKEELSITFFSKLKEDLKKYPDLQTLFPSTFRWLEAIDTEVYNYTSYLTMLREAFIKDFQVIIPNLKRVINDPRHDAYFKINTPLRSIFLYALVITDDLQHGVHPGEIVHHLSNQDFVEFDKAEPNIKPAFQTLDLMIQSFRSRDPNQYLVPFDSIRQKLFGEKTGVIRIYLGLIYQQSDNITFVIKNEKHSFRDILKDAEKTDQKLNNFINQYRNEVSEVVNHIYYVQETLEKIKEQNRTPGNNATYQEYYKFYDATLTLLEYVSDMPQLIEFQWTSRKDQYFFVARKLGEIYLDLNEKKYASVILNVAVVYDTIVNQQGKLQPSEITLELDSIRKNLVKLSTQLKGDVKTDMDKLVASLITTSKKINSSNTTSNNTEIFITLLKIGNFAASVAQAENSDQVEEAIKAIALPAGSARIKRESYMNVALNAYVGLFGGNEHIYGLEPHNDSFSAGLFAPVGIAFSRGGCKGDETKRMKGGKSWTAFVSVIDLGVLAAFRFSNDSAAVTPNIHLENILSPGIFIIYGLGRSPISIGGGAQVGPQLRDVEIQGNSISDDFYVRAHLFIAIDIPILNLYNRRQK